MERDDHVAVLAELDRIAPDLIGSGRPVRYADQVSALAARDLHGHPWARLLVACMMWDADCTDGRARVQALAALRAFRRRGEPRGEGYACWVLGNWAVMRGEIAAAGRWWDKAHPLVGAAAPASEIVLSHRGLAAYAEGRLGVAIAMAEEAVAVARLRGQSRQEATALVNVGVFRLWTGDFPAALVAFHAAEDAFDTVADPFDRYELPLCLAGRGVLWTLRGDHPRAEQDFTRALDVARLVREPLLEAIVRTVRADFTAAADPRRAGQDVRWALAELDRRGERWWRVWAEFASGVAALAAGMPGAAVTTLRDVLSHHQPPLERARTQLRLGEALLRTGAPGEAGPAFRAAAGVFEAAGARYFAACAYVGLSEADPAGAGDWISRARRTAGADPAYHALFRDTSTLRLVAFGAGTVIHCGQPIRLRTDNAAQALFLLALAGPGGMHAEQLAEYLWPDRVDRVRLLARVRTLLWDLRRGLDADAWRLQRRGPVLTLDITGVSFDLAEARAAAVTGDGDARPLREPVFTRWIYTDWVVAQQRHNDGLAARADRGPARASTH